MPHILLSILCTLNHILRCYYYTSMRNEQTKTERNYVTCPELNNSKADILN